MRPSVNHQVAIRSTAALMLAIDQHLRRHRRPDPPLHMLTLDFDNPPVIVIAMSWTVFSGSKRPLRLGIHRDTPYRSNFGHVRLN
jgi:hypothetical protein